MFAIGEVYTHGKFEAVVIDTGGNLLPASLTQVANLLPVSTTLAKLMEKFAAGVVDTIGNLLPVVHLDLRISLRIFKKIQNSPSGILWGWEETDS